MVEGAIRTRRLWTALQIRVLHFFGLLTCCLEHKEIATVPYSDSRETGGAGRELVKNAKTNRRQTHMTGRSWVRTMVIAVVVFSGLPTMPGAAQKRAITETDLFAFTWIGESALSPDGSKAVFVQTTVNAKKEGYESSLYLLDLKTQDAVPRRLTNGPSDSSPRWSPDGSSLAFVQATEKDGKSLPAQIYLLPLSGGEPMQISSLAKGASSPLWSPDGQWLAALSTTLIVPESPKVPGAEEKHVSDVRIISKAVYRSNGSGYDDVKSVDQLYLYRLPKAGEAVAKPQQLTEGRYGVEEFLWGKDSRSILYTSEHTDEPYYSMPHGELYRVDVSAAASDAKSTDKPAVPKSALVTTLPFEASAFSLSPDGKHLAFHGEDQPTPPRSYQQPDLFVMDLEGSAAGGKPPLNTLT